MNKRKKIKDRVMILLIITANIMIMCTEVYAGSPYTGAESRFFRSVDDSVPQKDPPDYPNTTALDTRRIQCGYSFHLEYATRGTEKTTTKEYRILPYGAEYIWFGTPYISCAKCQAKMESSSLYTSRIFIEDDAGNELASRNGLMLTAEDLDHVTMPVYARVALELTQTPADEVCPDCKRYPGDLISVDGMYIYVCECFGVVIDWLNHRMESDIHARIARFCSLQKGLIEEMIRRSINE